MHVGVVMGMARIQTVQATFSPQTLRTHGYCRYTSANPWETCAYEHMNQNAYSTLPP
jgi:hypothetical protein